MSLDSLLFRTRISSFVLLCVGIISSISCVESSASKIKEADSCSGDKYVFSLGSRDEALPSIEEINLKAEGLSTEDVFNYVVAPSKKRNLRLEICASTDNTFTLMSLAYKPWSNPYLILVLKDDAIFQVNNLEGLLSGDYEGVRIFAKADSSQELLLSSAKDKSGKPFLYFADINSSDVKYANPQVIVGNLVEADPFEEKVRLCPTSSDTYFITKLELGTAAIESEVCVYPKGGAGGTMGIRLLKVTVTDTNALLTEAQHKPIVLQGEALSKQVAFQTGQHNGCDSIYINLGHAQYAATSAVSDGGCAPPVANAPRREHSDQSKSVLYKLKYLDQPWSSEIELPTRYHIIFR